MPPAPPTGFVSTTDFVTGSYSTVNLRLASVAADLPAVPGIVEGDNGAVYFNDRVYVLNRFGFDNVTVLAADDLSRAVRQFSTGNGSSDGIQSAASAPSMSSSRSSTTPLQSLSRPSPQTSSVISQSPLLATASAGAGANTGLSGDDTATVGARLTWADRPTITYAPLSGQEFSRNLLTPIPPRALFTLIQAELRRSGFEDMVPAGIVLTGGTSKMEGVVELAEEIFHMPVRVGYPQTVQGLNDIVRNPIYATSVGLLLYGHENLARRGSRSTPISGNIGDVWGRMKAWFSGQF